MKKILFLFFASIIYLILLSCNKAESETVNQDYADSLKESYIVDYPKITYSLIEIKDKEQREKLMYEYRDSEDNHLKNKIFCLLNRKERRFMKVGSKVLVPDSIADNVLAYSIFPQYYKDAKDIPKIIIVSNKYQCYACYEYGVLVRFAAANTGKEKTQTYPGRYALVWRQLERRSSLDSTWVMPYTFNFHKYAGNAFHQFAMPGYAASHSCIRQFKDDAKWLYNWGEMAKRDEKGQLAHLTGTPVLIIDVFDYTNRHSGPWKNLRSNKDFFIDLPANPMEYEEALIPISQIPSVVRNSLPNKKRYITAEDTLRARGVIREGVKITQSINFNKLRRDKEARKRKEAEEKLKQESNTNQID